MSLTACTDCGGTVSTRAPVCPHCGAARPTEATCPECGGTVKPGAAACLGCGWRFRRLVTTPKRSAESELEWAHRWAIAGGVMLLAGFLLPLVTGSSFTTTMIWSWDMLEGAPIDALLAFLAIPAAGVIMLIVAFALPRRGVPQIMVCLGVVVLLVQLVLSPIARGMMARGPGMEVPAGLVIVLFSFTACGVAIANRIRKRHPSHPLPRQLACLCGIGFLAVLAIPFSDGKPAVAMLAEEGAWRHGWPAQLTLLLFIAYGIAGIVSVRKVKDARTLTQVVSLMGRSLLAAIPLSLLLSILMAFSSVGGGSQLAPVLMGLIKMCCLWYGLLAIPSVGVAAWISTSIGPPEPPPEPKVHKLARPVRRPIPGAVTPSTLPVETTPVPPSEPPPNPPA